MDQRKVKSRFFNAGKLVIERKNRDRKDPSSAEYSHLSSRKLPWEAGADNNEEEQRIIDKIDLSLANMYNGQVLEELDYFRLLVGLDGDPWSFLLPPDDDTCDNLLDRKVDPNKVVDLLVNYMNKYYDLTSDTNPFSNQRRAMDDQLWDNLTYLIPLMCNQLIDLLRTEQLIVSIEPDVLVFGDVHGNLNDLWYIYINFINDQRYSGHRFVFVGDYVDRGPKSIEVLCFLFALKLAQPERIVLLRGNHELMQFNRKYGLQRLCEQVFEGSFIKHPVMGSLVYKLFNMAFTYFPVGVVIKGTNDRSVFCCHGGVPSHYLKPAGQRDSAWKIEELNALAKKPVMAPGKYAQLPHLALYEILMNDPLPKHLRNEPSYQEKLFSNNKKRGGNSSTYAEKGLTTFLEANKMAMLIRGHQFSECKDNGYAFDFDRRMLTVFSCSNYCGTEQNTTGYAVVGGLECNVEALELRGSEESFKYKGFNNFKIIVDKQTRQVSEVFF